jgi:peptide/nickel transport system permease protein
MGWICRKLIRYGLALFIIFSLNFLIPRLMPGDPLLNLLGENASVTEDTLAGLRAEMGLDSPLGVQYLSYWGRLFRLDLGYSYFFHDRITSLILSRAGKTLLLLLPAILLGAWIGIAGGARAGWRSRRPGSRLATYGFLLLYSSPPFFLGMLALYVFAFLLGWFPLRSVYSSGNFAAVLHHLFLPGLVLTLFAAARNFLLMRGSVLQEKSKLYVLQARASGMARKDIVGRHITKNASLPVLTLVALDFGFLFSGALLIEIVFSLNGMGALIYDALLARDYPTLQGAFLLITITVILANICADILYCSLDPRVRQER